MEIEQVETDLLIVDSGFAGLWVRIGATTGDCRPIACNVTTPAWRLGLHCCADTPQQDMGLPSYEIRDSLLGSLFMHVSSFEESL